MTLSKYENQRERSPPKKEHKRKKENLITEGKNLIKDSANDGNENIDSKIKSKNDRPNTEHLKHTTVDTQENPRIKGRETVPEKKILIKEEKKKRDNTKGEGHKGKDIEMKEETKKAKNKKEEKEITKYDKNIKTNNKASQTYKIDSIYSTVVCSEKKKKIPQTDLMKKNEISKKPHGNKRTNLEKDKLSHKITKSEERHTSENEASIFSGHNELLNKKELLRYSNESIAFPQIQSNVLNTIRKKEDVEENKDNEKQDKTGENQKKENVIPLPIDVYGFSYIPLDKTRNVRWNYSNKSVKSDPAISNNTKETSRDINIPNEEKRESNTEYGMTPYFYKNQMENDLLNYHIVNLSISKYDQTYFDQYSDTNVEPYRYIQSTSNQMGKKESEMKIILRNSFKRISNFEYHIERKLCYDCFVAQEDRCLISYKKMMSVKNYMKYEKLKKRNEYMKKCYTFSYGFYCKKGKFHDNEETSSHALFSSYKLRKEIKHLYAYIKKNPGCNLFDLIKMKFNLCSETKLEEEKKELSFFNENKKEINKGESESVEEGTNVSLKFAIPSFTHTIDGKKCKDPPYDIIYNYYLEEGIENKNRKNSRRKILKDNTNELHEKYRLKQLESQYKMNECSTLRTNEQEEKYVTYQNIKLKHTYHFTCRKCKREERISKDKTLDVCYLNYLFSGMDRRKEKKRKKKKIEPTDLFYGFNDSNNSSASDEYSYINYSTRYKKSKKGGKNKSGKDSLKKKKEHALKNNKSTNIEHSNKVGKTEETQNTQSLVSYDHNKSNDEKYTMNDYLIQCKKCRYINKYDNISNEYLVNFCRNNGNFRYPFMLDIEREKGLYDFLHKEETVWESGYSNAILKNKKFTTNEPNQMGVRKISFSYSDLEDYEKVKNQIRKEKNHGEVKKDPIGHRTHGNIMLGNKRPELFRRKSNYDTDRGIKLKLNKIVDFLKYKKSSQLIQYLSNTKKPMCNINNEPMYRGKEHKTLSSTKAERRIKSEDNSNKKVENISSFSSIDKSLIKNEKKISSQYDMHLFTICDGHGDLDTSFFMVHNIHIVFYFLLIHTFFNVHYTFKLLYPLMDFLYYKMGDDEGLNKLCGSCIINLFFHKNYIYVSNIGDSKCAVVSFDLEKYEYKETTEKERNKGKKKRKNKKGKNKSKQKNNIINHKDSSHTFSDGSICNEETIISKTKGQCIRSSYFVINKNSISYNELNNEHNCNNYSEYLRLYKTYYHKILESLLVKEGESYKSLSEAVNTSQGNSNVNDISRHVNKRSSIRESLENKKKKKATKEYSNNKILNKELHEHIINLNKYILHKDKEFMIGNYSFDAVKLNRICGCLHPTRVIGDYDMKRNFHNVSMLSNFSSIYKYNLENINITNKVHYLYKNMYCDKCNKNYILSDYGRIGILRDIILLENHRNSSNVNNNNNNNNNNNDSPSCMTSTNCLRPTVPPKYMKSPESRTPMMTNEKESYIEIKNKEAIQKVFKIYYNSGSGELKEQSRKVEKEKNNLIHSEEIVPYIYEKKSTMNENNLFRIDRKNFFHLVILASDGVFEFIKPDYAFNIIIKNKPIHKKIQKIYKTYNTHANNLSFKEDINSLLHKYMITKEECKRLAKEIVKGTLTKGNFDDSTCFCIFLFPTIFFPL